MKVLTTSGDGATVELTVFDALVLLEAVTSLDDLIDGQPPFLDPARQPDADALYGDLYRLVHDDLGAGKRKP